MDTSNLPENHPCFISERKKIPGLFDDSVLRAASKVICIHFEWQGEDQSQGN